ncbi:MAG: tetratricopeptide repeat protein, partial [Anaerolineae bacterium]|nr:tetratricopeptide repeat protein [Anaerolineae bacterium]
EALPWRKWAPWAIGAVLLLLLVPAGALVARWQGARQMAQDYQEAVAHLEAGRPREALALLDQVLERDPTYRDAAALREQASQQVHLADLEAQAQAATVAGDWAEAIAAWADLRARAPDYRPAQVAEGLCAAYGGLGEAEAAAFASGRGTEHLEKALQAFRRAQRECAPEKAQTWQATFEALRQYAAGHQAAAQGDWDGAIAAWQQVYAAQPGLADVAQRLYDALVARGRVQAEAGEAEAARQDFAAALELDVPDHAEAQRGLEEVQALLAPTPAPEQPEAAPQRRAPRLLAPEDGAIFTSGKFTEIILQWEPVPDLAPDEFYSVTIMRKVGGEPRYWGHALRETQWKVSPLAGYGEADDDLFWWWVEVRKETGKDVDGKPMGPAMSPKSEVRSFTWR